MREKDTPLYEVFLRPRNGLSHRHVGSLHALDDGMAMQYARDLYTRRGEADSIWIVRSADLIASAPEDKEATFSPSDPDHKPYRHPTFYVLPKEVENM
jgi:ring-1,2-phenylacetyl-CoA epoxidase subunit PaaB